MGKYWKALVLGILIVVFAVTFWVGLRVVLRTEVPLLAVNSTSMYPALNYGDLIVVQGIANVSEISVAPVRQGDIVVFRRSNKPEALIISRVIDKTFENDAWYLRTCLDTQDLPDMWLHGVNSEETWERGFFHEKFLVGKVVSRIPFLGYIPLYVGMFILNPIVMVLLVIAAFLIVSLKYPFLFEEKAEAS